MDAGQPALPRILFTGAVMPSSNPTRREFAATAITAALTAACARALPAPAPAPAVSAPAVSAPAAAPAAAAVPPATTAPTLAPDPNAVQTEALTSIVFAQYGTVDPARRGDVKDGVARTLLLADRMRKVPIANAADPFSVCWNPVERAR